jgi:hypothetical protein
LLHLLPPLLLLPLLLSWCCQAQAVYLRRCMLASR